MKLIDVLKYLGGKVIVDELAGEFASLAVLSQQVGIGVIVVQRVGSDLVVGCKDASIISGARFTESVVEPLTFEEWEDIPLDMDDRVSLIELPLPLVYLFLNIPIRQEDATVIAARLPLSLASQLVQSRCEDGNYWLGLEDGILLLMFGPQEHKAVWVGQFGIRTGEEAIDFALNTYGDEMVSILKVSLEPEEVRYERAQVLLDSARAVWSEEKDIDKALELAQQVVDVLPVQARTLTAQIYRMNGDYDKAVQELMPLMEQGIATEEVYGNLARLYEQQDKVLQAVKTLRTALEKDGIDTLQILRYLVALYTKRQMVTELIETLDEIISLCEGVEEDQAQETLHWALHRKGLAFMLKGDTRQSLVFLEKAVEIEPADVGPYQDLARAYRELGDTREAIAVLQRALEHLTDEDKIKAYNTIGHIHMSLQQYADAADAYCKILELDSANLEALMQLGLIYIRLSDTKKARSYFEQAAQINPDNPMVKNYLMKLQGEAKAEIRPMAGPREDVRLRGEPQVDELFAQLHTRVKKELTPRPGQLVDEVDPVGVGWSRFYEGIKKGKSLKQRARCFLGAAQMARIANDPHLFVLATAQYCAGRGYFEFRFRGDHQAARHVYYRTFVRLIKYLAAIPRSMSVSYRNAINAYLYSCLGTVQMPGHLSSDQLIGAVLEDKRGAEVLEEEIAFLIEENPALLIEIANWLNVHKATFVEKCVGIIQKLIASKSYNAFSALLRLDRDVSYFDAVIQRLRPKEAIHLAQALMDFGDPSMTSKAVR
ncbi:MAG TPA: tetratricopeptide repeat protein, partial [Desulfobacterales bacterium]|nr:tetratricopeptide repeat protein [Desulfobacterales bacterium]